MTSLSATKATGAGEESASAPRMWGVFTAEGLLITGVLGLAFVALFYRWFLKQHQWSWGSEDWGHAYFIPVISAYMIHQRRQEIARIKARVFWPGLAPMLLGIMTYFFAVVGVPNHMIQGFAIVLTLFGLVLLVGGPELMKPLFVPIGFLVFAVTISKMIMIQITFPLQLVASQGAWVILGLLGAVFDFGVDVEGNTLTVIGSQGPFPLNVAEACSGMRMVIAFLALGTAVALLGCRYWFQRIMLVLLATPVAVFMNIVRVAALGVASLFDQNLVGGQAHMFIGTVLLVPGLLLFMGVVWVLNRLVDEPSDKPAKKPKKKRART